MHRSNRFGWGRLFVLVIVCVSNSLLAQSKQKIELETNWKIISSKQLVDSGAVISQLSYRADKWHSIRRMPATVLAALQADGVYPHLYYGMNLLTEVPRDLWKQDWWYRTSFQVPTGAHTFWIDFPGINYRAEIWLNGELVADNQQVVGMYTDHSFNVTHFVDPGNSNILAVKVTPERLIRDVNGVELADSWHDWINWKYLGYHGPLNVLDLPTRSFTASYLAPGSSVVGASATAKVTIQAASTSSFTLDAAVSSQGVPVRSGTVNLMRDGYPVGRAVVNADGTATLTIHHSAENLVSGGISFVPDRNAGIWKPVFLYITGPVKLSNALVDTELPLPGTDPAKLTVYANVTNGSSSSVRGDLEGEITRAGKPSIHISQPVSLSPGETREISFAPSSFPQLIVHNPELWWPYTMGKPALYELHLNFVANNETSDSESIRFGIREITQHRDHSEQFLAVGKGGNFYLQINGKNFLIRGAAYTPDLLYRDDPKREATAIAYAKDLGLNMLRSEGKIFSEHLVELADEAGMPLMYGWMCCNQWERWKQWSPEDQAVARESLRSQVLMLRSHAAVFLWADGSDGLPPPPVRDAYHRILTNLHWQDAVVDTVSSFAKDSDGQVLWDGIQMDGPYAWRPPSYWFAGRYAGAQGSLAEEGDNENVPPYESLQKFIPPDKLWPINKYWYFHAGATRGNNELLNTQIALTRRYGPSSSAEEFAKKAQVGLYEDTRAQFEDFAANGWATHKMSIYWMFNEPWPSFFGHLFDYYEKPGGAYYGAKKGLRPLSAVFDYYATGDHKQGNIRVVNQTISNRDDLRLRVRVYDLLGHVRYDQQASPIHVPAQGVALGLTLPRIKGVTSTYFVRCELFDRSGLRLVENNYWQSTTLDDLGSPSNDNAFKIKQVSWADFTALNTMPKVQLQIAGVDHSSRAKDEVAITLHNPTDDIAFFERVSVTRGKDEEEILPITYNDNYVTVFPRETVHIFSRFGHAVSDKGQLWLRLEGYNTSKELTLVH
jgi:exo-1,4-beta-D-glucosaminidase